MVTYNDFKQREWDNLRSQILNNKIEALEIFVTPYTSHGKFKESQALLVNTYSRTDKVPEKDSMTANGLQAAPSFVISAAAVTINWLTRILPEVIPFTTQILLQSLKHDGIVRPCTELGSIGSNGNATPTKANGFAFSYNKNKLFNFMDDWIKLMNKFKTNDRNQVTPFPLAIRFSSYKTKGLLNMFNNNNNGNNGYFWFENIIPHFDSINSQISATIENVDEIMYKVQLLSLSKPYFGNPHWGLTLFLNKNENIFKNIDKEKFNKFITIYKQYNKTKTFSNQFTRQSGLDNIAQL